MTKQLKRLGLVAVEHYPSIADIKMSNVNVFFCTDLECPKLSQYNEYRTNIE